MFGYLMYFFFIAGVFDKDYTPKELVENFNRKKKEIYTLKHYYNAIVPKNKAVEIEFDGSNELSRFGIYTINANRNSTSQEFLEWNLKISSSRMDSILSTIGWSRQTLKSIKEKLDNANCIEIESGEPTKIGFKRSGLGMYSFNVFDSPISDSIRELHKDTCTYIIVSDKLILEYGGGAIGPQCFYNKE